MINNSGQIQKDNGAQVTTLRDALAPLIRHRRARTITFAGVFVLATVLAWVWAARYYQATMQVVVEQDRSDPAITAAQVANISTSKAITMDQVASEVTLLQGTDMLSEVVNTCGLVKDEWSPMDIFLPWDKAQRMAAKRELEARSLAKKIKVEAATTSDVIDGKSGRRGGPENPAFVFRLLGRFYWANIFC